MCKLIVLAKREGPNTTARLCVWNQYRDMSAERHGFSSLAVISGKARKFLALDPNKYADAYTETLDALDGSTLAILHTRTATSGSVSERNLHTARDDRGRVIAHNGIVGKFSTWGKAFKQTPLMVPSAKDSTPDEARGWSINKAKKAIRKANYIIEKCSDCRGVDLPCTKHIDEAIMADWMTEMIENRKAGASVPKTKAEPKPEVPDETDSYQFLKALPDILTEKTLEDAMDKYEFNGIACIYDANNGDAWMLATRDMYAHTDGEFIALYSYRPDALTEYETVAGLPVRYDSERVRFAMVDAGVYRIGALG